MPRKPTTYQFDLFSKPERGGHDADAAMAEAARRDASIRDEADGKPDPRSRRKMSALPERGRSVMMHEKISPHHLERKAILYVRQPSGPSGAAQSRERNRSKRLFSESASNAVHGTAEERGGLCLCRSHRSGPGTQDWALPARINIMMPEAHRARSLSCEPCGSNPAQMSSMRGGYGPCECPPFLAQRQCGAAILLRSTARG